LDPLVRTWTSVFGVSVRSHGRIESGRQCIGFTAAFGHWWDVFLALPFPAGSLAGAAPPVGALQKSLVRAVSLAGTGLLPAFPIETFRRLCLGSPGASIRVSKDPLHRSIHAPSTPAFLSDGRNHLGFLLRPAHANGWVPFRLRGFSPP